ncbi:MAG: SH3 domain-containing protein [Oscillatoriophycideae cyanobacterium NC_groundwater_1537_Pr4_S-0.65um_50_18]|nr:SH3 domain-containing protein [Oscillatoriophycideae cyanobacterium NC_groundwater_1537_Pr4_S-0.65um_50_18]
MSLSGISKFILGFLLAIALLALAGYGATRYVLAQLATPPARPIFPNDPSPSAAPVGVSPSPSPSPVPSVAPSPVVEGYPARVTQPIGLILRQEPSGEAARVGGIDFNQELTVLEEAPDGAWQRVRLADGTEGWIKGGNTEKLN